MPNEENEKKSMNQRHQKAALLVQKKALDVFIAADAATIKPSEARQMLKTAADIERGAQAATVSPEAHKAAVAALWAAVWNES